MADNEKKGFSLRKRVRRSKDLRQHPVISAPQPISKPSAPISGPNGPGVGTGTKGPAPLSKQQRPQGAEPTTSNMIMKRRSYRYVQNDGSRSTPPPPMPGLPPLPPGVAGGSRDPSPGQRRPGPGGPGGPPGGPPGQAPPGGPATVDLRALSNPNLPIEQYVSQFMSNASEDDINNFQQKLKQVQNRASIELQQNASRNRDQFIKVSKEAQKLNEQLQSLRALLDDQASTLGQTIQLDGGGGGSPAFDDGFKKRANRSSVANLEAMWSSQLQTLWKHIEGSQKFLAAIPGRHVISESGHWVELDAATWKPRRPAHIVLLNDHLLVAVRKRKRVDPNVPGAQQKAPTKLVADRCFPLTDIDLVDLSTSTSIETRGPADERVLANAITVRHGHESFTYRADVANNKPELLTAFKRAIDELRRNERSETGNDNGNGSRNKEGMTYLATRDPAINNNAGLLRSMSKTGKDRPEILIEVDGKQENLRWVEGQIDQLDIDLALQRFDEAVDRVEKLRNIAKGLRGNAVAQDLIVAKVEPRAVKLAELLTNYLRDDRATVSNVKQLTEHLSRLDFAAKARTAYLESRSELVKRRERQCVFDGNVLKHVTEICVVYFTLIRNTVNVYQSCFPAVMMSACIVWAKSHVDDFNNALERALSGVERGGKVYKDGLARARELSKVMDEVGLDFGGLVGRGLD